MYSPVVLHVALVREAAAAQVACVLLHALVYVRDMLQHERARAELLAAQVAREWPLTGVDAVVLDKASLMVPQAVVVALVALQVLLAVHVHVPPAEWVLLASGSATLPAQVVGDLVCPQ